jgi:hypothetical protein
MLPVTLFPTPSLIGRTGRRADIHANPTVTLTMDNDLMRPQRTTNHLGQPLTAIRVTMESTAVGCA